MKSDDQLFDDLLIIKKKNDLILFDTHVHPQDVFGIDDADGGACGHVDEPQLVPSLLEKLKYSNFAIKVLALLFVFTPGYIRKEIKKNFSGTNQKILLREMDKAGIDSASIIPIEPKAPVRKIHDMYTSPRFIRLGSIDIHSISEDLIEGEIRSQIEHYGIVGLKMHPNIQDFYPEPSLNDPEIERKLTKIYDLVNTHGLYMLIHGGISYVPDGNKFKKMKKGQLKNFFNEAGGSFIEKLTVPIIIAHLGGYNEPSIDFKNIERLFSKSMDVYFDTAGVSPLFVRMFMERYDTDRLIFGSDCLYFNLAHSVKLILRVLYEYSQKDFEVNLTKVFSVNYSQSILANRKK